LEVFKERTPKLENSRTDRGCRLGGEKKKRKEGRKEGLKKEILTTISPQETRTKSSLEEKR